MALVRRSLLLLLAQQTLPVALASGESTPLSKYGTQICTGMVEAFLHKGNLTRGEVDCLVSAMGDVSLGAYESAKNVASLFGQLSGFGGASAAPPPPLVVLRLAKSMHGLVHMLDGVMGSCVKGHSLELLTKAGNHLGNLTYVTSRLIANSVDIAEELSDAVAAFNRNDYKRFGSDVGTVGRKVLLSNASSEILPEGPPSLEQLVNVSAGLLQGFFGEGFELVVGSDARIVTQPKKHVMDFIQDGNSTGKEGHEVIVSQDKARLNVHIDLHRCVSQNIGLFRSVMSKAWFYFAEAAMQLSDHVMRRFMAVMLQGLPGALARCGVEPKQQAMLADSIHSLRHVELRLRMPEGAASVTGAAKEMRTAAAHWDKMSWFEFGTDLGRMLQGLVVKAHPDRYMVTSVGTLRQAATEAMTLSGEADEELLKADKPSASMLASGGFSSADELGAGSGLSASGVQIVEGIAEGLLHQKNLSHPEAECLMKSVGGVLGGASQAAENLVAIFDDLFVAFEGISGEGAPQADATELMRELTRSFDGVARLAEGFMADCRSSAAEAFQLALEHAADMDYVTGRLVANGADVQDGIDRAVASWKHFQPREFGREVGLVLRKVLLSSKSEPVLPEGVLSMDEIVNVSAGLLEGFFGRGFELDISSDHRIVTAPLFPLAMLLGGEGTKDQKVEAKRLDVHIDLHLCVESNLPFFQRIFTKAGLFFATEEVEPSPGMLMAALVQLPTVLKKCGIDEEQETMLLESVETLSSLHMKLQVPQNSTAMDLDHAAELLKTCVSDWSKLQWFALGKDLGKMLRETVLTLLPALYSVDGQGTLRKQLLGLSDTAPVEGTARVAPRGLASAERLLLAGALVLVAGLVVARVAVAARRRLGPSGGPQHFAVGLEAGSDAEDFEAGLVRRAGALE